MSTREYIGARYVPKFYQNSVDGSTQWQANVVYEPLMWVTLQNSHMYISKKQVPATVGSPADNIDYWLDIGSYNGFIAGLDTRITAIESLVAQYNTKRAVFIGDSFMVGGCQNSIAQNFGIPSDNCYFYGNTGAGYIRVNPSGQPWGSYNFEGLVDLAYNKILLDELTGDDIDYVFIYGGINDGDSSPSDVGTAAASCFAKAKQRFPKAEIVVGCNAGKAALSWTYKQMYDLIYTYADMRGCKALRGIEHTLYNMSNLVDSSDNIHPNANGVSVIGYFFRAMYEGNDPFNRMYKYTVNNTVCNGTVNVQVTKDTVNIDYNLTWVDTSSANPSITLQERGVPARSVGSCPANNVAGAFLEINNGGLVYMFGQKTANGVYMGSLSYPLGVA